MGYECGTRTAYNKGGCRCDDCTQANTEYHQQYRSGEVIYLATLVWRKQPWRDRAKCADMPSSVFFPNGHYLELWEAARRICLDCPVRAECLDDAMKEEGHGRPAYGMRGGKTPAERDEIRKKRRPSASNPQDTYASVTG